MDNYLATNLRYLRKQNKITQEYLSSLFGVVPSAIGGWETAYREPNLKTIIKFADIYKVSLDDLIRKDLRIEPYEKVECSKEYINKRIEDSDLSFKKKKVLSDFLETFIDLD